MAAAARSCVVVVVALAVRVSAGVSSVCASLRSTDAILVVDLQNCFLVTRPVRSDVAPAYEIEADWTSLPKGRLNVPDTETIVDTANAWLRLAKDSNALVFATLDWHPARHCSFCTSGQNTNASEGIAIGSACIRGSLSAAIDDSPRCQDAVSEAAYNLQSYFQWPRHCEAGSFDARFDPYLEMPDDATVVKLGVYQEQDSYSAFDGGRISTAAGRADATGADSLVGLADETATLAAAIDGVKRLWVMGLATDFVVKHTVYDALGSSDPLGQSDVPANLERVIVVDAATRAVTDVVGEQDKLKMVARGATVVTAVAPEDALVELCAGTCDVRADCDGDGVWCDSAANDEWGACTSCPLGVNGMFCSGRGSCTDVGSCECGADFEGDACESTRCPPGTFKVGDGCELCPAGTFSPFTNSPECTVCAFKKYQDQEGATNCTDCPANSWRVTATAELIVKGGAVAEAGMHVTDCTCEQGFYATVHHANRTAKMHPMTWGFAGVPCKACPNFATCDGNEAAPRNWKGYWGFEEFPTKFYACDDPDSCKEGYECARGLRGNGCGRLEEDRWAISGFPGNFKCPTGWRKPFMFVILWGGVFTFWYFINARLLPNLPAFAICLDNVQILAILTDFSVQKWPTVMNYITPAFQLLLFDTDVLSPNCFVRWRVRESFFSQFILATTGLASFLAIIARIVVRVLRHPTERSWASVRENWFHRLDHLAVERAIGASFCMIDVCYPTLNVLAFSALRCYRLSDGRDWMVLDASIACNSRTRVGITVLASLTIAALVVLPIHLVLFRVCLELRRRGGVHRGSFRRKYGFAVEAYRAPFFYWKALPMYRTVLICASATSFERMQVKGAAQTMVLVFCSALHWKYLPFRSRGENLLEGVASVGCFLYALSLSLLDMESDTVRLTWSVWVVVLLVTLFALTCNFDLQERKRSRATARFIAATLAKAPGASNAERLILQLCDFRHRGRDFLTEALTTLYRKEKDETLSKTADGGSSHRDGDDLSVESIVKVGQLLEHGAVLEGVGFAPGTPRHDSGHADTCRRLDAASRSLEDFARTLDPAALEAWTSAAAPDAVGRMVVIAAATQRFLADEAPVSSFSADARAKFWRSLVADSPEVLGGICLMPPSERRVLFGSLLALEQCAATPSPIKVGDEARSALLYCLLSAPETESETLVAFLGELGGMNPEVAAVPDRPHFETKYESWHRREHDAVAANGRLAAAAPSAQLLPLEKDNSLEAAAASVARRKRKKKKRSSSTASENSDDLIAALEAAAGFSTFRKSSPGADDAGFFGCAWGV